MKQVESLRYDVIFKKAFGDKKVFTAFVHDILGIDLEIDEVEKDKQYSPSIGNVATKFDLYAEDKKNRVIVDIQHRRLPDHYQRFLYYHCTALLEQVVKSEDYRPKLKVFTIVVLTSGDKHKTDVSVIDFDPKKLNGEPLGEIEHKVIFICPKYIQDETPKEYREWLEAIEDSLDEEVDESHYSKPEIKSIFNAIEKDKVTPEERRIMFDQHANEQFEQELFDKWEQAEEKLKETQQEAEEKMRETARKLKGIGTLLDEQIASATGLSLDEIKNL